MATTIKVATIQIKSENGKITQNLEHAHKFVDDAAKQGANLILLPEFFSTGYLLTSDIWDFAETMNGSTVSWLRSTSLKYKVFIGTSFLEADGEDFYNTFILTRPDGTIAGRVRKENPATAEAFFFKGDVNDHVINTPFGKIGVAICNDNFIKDTMSKIHKHDIDLLLSPYSAPAPNSEAFALFTQSAIEASDKLFANIASNHAKALGVPVVMSNKVGKWRSPLPGIPEEVVCDFYGYSTITDSYGNVIQQATKEDGECTLVAEVTLDPSAKVRKDSYEQIWGRYSVPVPYFFLAFRVNEWIGSTSYKVRPQRRMKALAVTNPNYHAPEVNGDDQMKKAIANSMAFLSVSTLLYCYGHKLKDIPIDVEGFMEGISDTLTNIFQ